MPLPSTPHFGLIKSVPPFAENKLFRRSDIDMSTEIPTCLINVACKRKFSKQKYNQREAAIKNFLNSKNLKKLIFWRHVQQNFVHKFLPLFSFPCVRKRCDMNFVGEVWQFVLNSKRQNCAKRQNKNRPESYNFLRLALDSVQFQSTNQPTNQTTNQPTHTHTHTKKKNKNNMHQNNKANKK